MVPFGISGELTSGVCVPQIACTSMTQILPCRVLYVALALREPRGASAPGGLHHSVFFSFSFFWLPTPVWTPRCPCAWRAELLSFLLAHYFVDPVVPVRLEV